MCLGAVPSRDARSATPGCVNADARRAIGAAVCARQDSRRLRPRRARRAERPVYGQPPHRADLARERVHHEAEGLDRPEQGRVIALPEDPATSSSIPTSTVSSPAGAWPSIGRGGSRRAPAISSRSRCSPGSSAGSSWPRSRGPGSAGNLFLRRFLLHVLPAGFVKIRLCHPTPREKAANFGYLRAATTDEVRRAERATRRP